MGSPVTSRAGELVVLGVDTHADAHVAVALDGLGRRLGSTEAPATEAGYAKLIAWAEGFGALERVGLEGSGSFGVGLARFLRARGVELVEVNRPNRQHRRRFGKHDTADAEAAARAVQAGAATGEPKSADGPAEMVRVLHVVRRSAVKARTQAANQLRALLVTAPEDLKTELAGLSTAKLVAIAARFRPGSSPDDVRTATKLAMKSVARRHLRLSEEIAELEEQIARLVAEAVPALASLRGIGTDTAASLLVAVGDNPERLKSEASFARLCGVAPLAASLLGQDGSPPPQPRGQPGREPGAARAGARADELGRAHPRVRREAHRRGQEREGDPAVPQALRRPRGLPSPHSDAGRGATPAASTFSGTLTDIGASLGASEQDEFLRAAFRVMVICSIEPERFVFLRTSARPTPRWHPSTDGLEGGSGRTKRPLATGART